MDTPPSTDDEPSTSLPGKGVGPSRLPLPALLALATAVFVTSLTETLPAGVLPGMGAGLGVDQAAAGQAVTVYAAGTALTALPLTAATASWRRKRLLLTAVGAFAVANTVTAVSGSYPLTMAARFLAGVAAGLAWALLAGYARRLVAAPLRGKAVAVVMTGIPLALSLGVPAGAFLARTLDWRAAFLTMTVLALAAIGWIAVAVPELPGQRAGGGPVGVRAVPGVPGVLPVLTVTLVLVLGHTVLYAYVAAYLDAAGLGGSTDLVLLVFGAASLLAIRVVAARVHGALRALTVGGTGLIAVAALALGLLPGSAAAVYAAVVLWGLGWGGVPTLLQTAVGEAGGERADAAQAALVTLWNVAMAAGGVLGGLLLDAAGAAALPWGALALVLPALAVVVGARRHGFPARRARSPVRSPSAPPSGHLSSRRTT